MGPAEAVEHDYSRKWLAFTAIAVSYFTMVMTTTMVFVALSAIADDFGVSLRVVAWVVIAESLILSALMLPVAGLGDKIGRKRVHLTGVALFGAGALFTALAPTFALLIVARIVMAVGNVMSQSVGTAMVVSIFPPHERGKALGSQTTAVSIGGATGPIVGGLLLQVAPWEVLFLLLLLPATVGFVSGWFLLDEATVNSGARAGAKLDWRGSVLSGLVITCVILLISNPLNVSWISPLVGVGSVVTVALIVVFVRWERKVERPMIDVRLFANKVFRNAAVCRTLGFMGNATLRFLLPLYLISLRGLAEGAAGVVMFLIAFGMGFAAQMSGRLSDRHGEAKFVMTGLGTLAALGVVLAMISETSPMWWVSVIALVFGLANGIWNVPNNSMMIGASPASSLGVVAALSNLMRNLGNVFGQAIASTVIVGVMVANDFDIPLSEIGDTPGASDAFMDGWRLTFVIMTAYMVLAMVLVATGRFAAKPADDPAETTFVSR